MSKQDDIEAVRTSHDQRIVARETIGCALAVLRRLDHVRLDSDVREVITKARSALSVAQSTIRGRIDG